MQHAQIMPEKEIEKQVYEEVPGNADRSRKMKKDIDKFMQGAVMQVLMACILMLSLFLPDAWILANAPQENDRALYGVLMGILVVFLLEMVVLSIVQGGYFLKFYFWLDFVGTVSMIFDIGWIADEFIPTKTSVAQTSLVRATRAAKLGARYGRLLRLLRLMRYLKYLPCLKNLAEEDFEPTMKAIKKVSEKLSNLMSMRTAMLVLILVIVVPFLSYPTSDYSANAWVDMAKMMAKNETTTWYDIESFGVKCQHFYEPKDFPLRLLKIESPWYGEEYRVVYHTRENLRYDNIGKFMSSYYIENSLLLSSGNSYAIDYVNNAAANGRDGRDGYTEFRVNLELDQTVASQDSAMFNILIIILVLVLLMVFSGSFTGTVNKIVIQPLEAMMKTLRGSAMLMITSLKSLETAQSNEEKSKKPGEVKDSEDTDTIDEDMETAMLEQMVEKLARIVQHIIPNDKAIETGNMDSNTANWLNTQFTQGHGQRQLEIHRADSVLLAESDVLKKLARLESTISASMIQDINTWNFDVLKYENDELHKVMLYLFSKLNLLEEFKVPEEVFMNFCAALAGKYINSNSYHNYKHGVDVCFTSFKLMYVPGLNVALSTLEVFSVLVGALAHDVGHPGLNNAYLIKTQHELAVRHNDRSPLENMHCVTLYEVLAKPETNVMIGLDLKQKIEARNIILTIILGTDMAHHFEQISKTQLFLEVNGGDTKAFCSGSKDVIDCFREDKNRLFIMELVLHCSDISNPFKPYELCAKWADLVVEEFCQQGDKERALGLAISPMCDRTSINLCNMQMGFIEFVVAPLIIAFVNIFPPLHEIGSNMLNNYTSWGERRKQEISFDDSVTPDKKPEETKKMDERIGRFGEKFSFLQQYKALPVRRRISGNYIQVK